MCDSRVYSSISDFDGHKHCDNNIQGVYKKHQNVFIKWNKLLTSFYVFWVKSQLLHCDFNWHKHYVYNKQGVYKNDQKVIMKWN